MSDFATLLLVLFLYVFLIAFALPKLGVPT